jgi:hypothetical protein
MAVVVHRLLLLSVCNIGRIIAVYSHMRTYLLLICLLFVTQSFAQKQSVADLERLKNYEDTLVGLADSILHSEDEFVRQQAVYSFIPALVKALKVPGSYQYPFSRLETMSIVRSPDEKFRIFTWDLRKDNGTYRFYGAIQKKNSKELELYPLFDNSTFMITEEDTTLNAEAWFGCLYYKVIKAKKHYVLFGWDGNNMASNKKVIEVLWWDKEGKPMFGLPVFHFPEAIKSRVIFEYKKNAGITVNYDANKKMIVFDHLIPEEGNERAKMTYVPDGTYEGLELHKDSWNYVEKVFHFSIDKPDQPPLPNPQDDHGLGER